MEKTGNKEIDEKGIGAKDKILLLGNLLEGIYDSKKIPILNPGIIELILKDHYLKINDALLTPIDLHFLLFSKGPVDDNILNIVAKCLGIDVTDLEKTENIEKINSALQKARNYITYVLGFKTPEVEIKSKGDVIELIKQTSRYKESKNNLSQHAMYCALVSVTLACFELRKIELSKLTKEMEDIENIFFHGPGTDGGIFTDEFQELNKGKPIKIFIDGIEQKTPFIFSIRGKSDNSRITKLLANPEFSAESASKDAIAMRIVVDEKNKLDVIEKILDFLVKGPFKAKIEEIDNRGFLSDSDTKLLLGNIDGLKIKRYSNPKSASSYVVFNIIANVQIPDQKVNDFKERKIEVQISEIGNKNEKNMNAHHIYDLKKLIMVMTRLFGACNKKWIKKKLLYLTKEAGFLVKNDDEYVDNVINNLLDKKENFLIKIPGKKGLYASKDVYKRWAAGNLLPETLKPLLKQ